MISAVIIRLWNSGIRERPLLVLMTLTGLAGFSLGIFNACWQVAVEGAQVIAGMVQYPETNPFYIYQIKAWTLLHQLPALGLRLGLTEKFLSVVLSGIMGLLSFQALALSVYVFSRNFWISFISTYLIYYTGSVNLGPSYPILLMGSCATYGSVGLSFLFLAMGLLGAGCIRAGAFMAGLSVAVHASLGVLGCAVILIAALFEWNQNKNYRIPLMLYFALGASLSLLSLSFQLPLMKSIPPIDPGEAKRYLASFTRIWDAHRQPVDLISPGVLINGAVFLISLIWLRHFSDVMTQSQRLMMRIYQAVTLLSGIFALLSWLPPEKLPGWFLMLMSTRLLNVAILGFPGLLMGLAWTYRDHKNARMLLVLAMLLLYEHMLRLFFYTAAAWFGYRFVKTDGVYFYRHLQSSSRAIRVIAVILASGIILKTGLFIKRHYQAQQNQMKNAWGYWENDSFYRKVSEGKGMLLLGADLYMQQLVTRRPVLMDAQALDMLNYAWEAGPESFRILKDIYRVDLFSPPPDVRGAAALPEGATQQMLENRTLEDWKKIRRDFGVTQLLISKGETVELPLIASGTECELYEIPA